MRILAVGAHPDDIDFSCSATMKILMEEGHDIFYLICTNGDKGGTRNRFQSEELAEIRRTEQIKAGNMVGVRDFFFLNIPDGELSPCSALRRDMVRVIRKVKPDRVYSFDPANQSFDSFHLFHSDHRAVAVSVFDAIFPASKNRLYFPELVDEGLEPHIVKELFFFGTREPDIWVDIGSAVEGKIECIMAHSSQFNGEDRIRIEGFVRERGRMSAVGKNFEYAEAFRRISF